ncbi:hypothetical protein Hamer_G013737 [Homarus americanus]|uniref:Uncharacterized protein n=1 Tax=Homarus americanus TaxID=6706 RepID=A0A8J5K7P3_HOMAM|nr:hypothetical protein Hamer_G013737 [Homarus americanus]
MSSSYLISREFPWGLYSEYSNLQRACVCGSCMGVLRLVRELMSGVPSTSSNQHSLHTSHGGRTVSSSLLIHCFLGWW